jgi:hypothetical protein
VAVIVFNNNDLIRQVVFVVFPECGILSVVDEGVSINAVIMFVEQLLMLLKSNVARRIPTLVFCNKSSTACFLGYFLDSNNVQNIVLHGRMPQSVSLIIIDLSPTYLAKYLYFLGFFHNYVYWTLSAGIVSRHAENVYYN